MIKLKTKTGVFIMENEYTYPPKKDLFALTSLFAGVIAILSSSTIILGIFIGIVAITLGIISRINFEKFSHQNVLGITFGVIALFLSSVMLLGCILLLRDPETMKQLQEIMKMYYGQ